MRRAAIGALALCLALLGVGLFRSWLNGDVPAQMQPDPAATADPVPGPAAPFSPPPAASAPAVAPAPPASTTRQAPWPTASHDASPFDESRHRSRKVKRAERALFQRQLTAGLNRLQPLLEQCPNAQHAGGIGGSAPVETPSSPEALIQQLESLAARAGGGRAELRDQQMVLRHIETLSNKAGAAPRRARGLGEGTSLLLDITPFDGKVEILDVADGMNGAVSDEFVACARNLLRGQFVRVPASRAGARLRTSVTLGSQVQTVPPGSLEEAREGELANAGSEMGRAFDQTPAGAGEQTGGGTRLR